LKAFELPEQTLVVMNPPHGATGDSWSRNNLPTIVEKNVIKMRKGRQKDSEKSVKVAISKRQSRALQGFDAWCPGSGL